MDPSLKCYSIGYNQDLFCVKLYFKAIQFHTVSYTEKAAVPLTVNFKDVIFAILILILTYMLFLVDIYGITK